MFTDVKVVPNNTLFKQNKVFPVKQNFKRTK